MIRAYVWTALVLCAVAVVLKLTGLLTWSWWWVLAPLWVPWFLASIAIMAVLVALAVVIVAEKLS